MILSENFFSWITQMRTYSFPMSTLSEFENLVFFRLAITKEETVDFIL